MSRRKFVPVVHAATLERPDEADTIEAAQGIARTLVRLDFASEIVPLDLDMSPLVSLAARRPHCVFNLVEAIATDVRLAPFAAAAMDRLELRYTGSPFDTLVTVLSKTRCKERLQAAGIATPAWTDGSTALPAGTRVLVKSDAEHASVGIDAESVVAAAVAPQVIADRQTSFGSRFFAESFIDGREFNAAILAGPDGPEVLPIPEIDFVDYPASKPRIVDYDAKWLPASFAYNRTPRKFGIETSDPRLARKLRRLALDCWHLFDMAGYARIDFRVDASGKPWVIDINTNPCITPEAGFAASAEAAGMSYDGLIERVLLAALMPGGTGVHRKGPAREREAAARLVSAPGADAVAGTGGQAWPNGPWPLVGLGAPQDVSREPAGRYGPGRLDSAGGSLLAELPQDLQPMSGLVAAARPKRKTAATFRSMVHAEDIQRVRSLVQTTGFFSAEEVAIAGELVEERVAKGPRSGYEFVLAEQAGELLGYTCFGRIAGSVWAFDLYWIAVASEHQGRGIGKALIERTEQALARLGCRHVYAETSSTQLYAPTREFYLRMGFHEAARYPDFYRAGDGKVVYCKTIGAGSAVQSPADGGQR